MNDLRISYLACSIAATVAGCTVLAWGYHIEHGPTADRQSASIPAKHRSISFVVPTPAAVDIFWVDSAGNIGMRGVESVIPGKPSSDPKAPQISEACRASATRNGDGTLTLCMVPEVGKLLVEKLGEPR